MYGVVLEGGGAKGAYHIGACKALQELGIEIKGVAGTSVGALNGAMIAQNDLEKAYDMWYNMSYSKVINLSEDEFQKIKNLDITKENVVYLINRIKGVLNNGGLDVTPLKNLLNDLIDEDKLRNSGIDLGIVTVSLTDLKPLELFLEDIPKGEIINYLMASAYFPTFKKEKMNGKLYLDGGVYDNLPIRLLYSKGYREIIAIRTHGLGRVRRFDHKKANITYIIPKENLGGTLDFDRENARKNLKLGYFDTHRAFEGLKGNKYYIEPMDDEDYFLNYFLKLGEDKISRVCEILGINDIPYRRALFEVLIPRISDLLNIDKDKGYEDICIMLYEEIAKIYDVDRFKVYRFDEFILEIAKNNSHNRNLSVKSIPKFIKQSELFSKLAKEEIISQIAFELFKDKL